MKRLETMIQSYCNKLIHFLFICAKDLNCMFDNHVIYFDCDILNLQFHVFFQKKIYLTILIVIKLGFQLI